MLTLGDRDPSRSPHLSELGSLRHELRCSAPRTVPGSTNPSIPGLRFSMLGRAGSALTGPLRCGEAAEDQPEGWRARCAPVRRQHTDVLSANPAAASRTRRAGARRAHCRGRLLFGYLLLAKQEKVTRSAKGRAKSSISKKEPKPAPLDLCSLSPYAYPRAQARLARRSFGATHDPPAQSDFFSTMPMPDKESAREVRVNRRPLDRFHGGRRMVSCGVRLPRSHLSPYGAASATGATFQRRHFSDFPHCKLLYMAA